MTRLIKAAVTLMLINSAWLPAHGQDTNKNGVTSWIEKSNEHSKIVLDVFARFSPERAAGLGVDGLDEEIFDLNKNICERTNKSFRAVIKELNKRPNTL